MNKKQQTEKLIRPHIFMFKGRKAIAMESATLDFKRTLIYKGVTPSGNVKLGEIIFSGPAGIKTKNRIAKVRKIGGKKVLALGSGRGSSNYYLDLE
ncbi:MAG: hypothetical protein ACOCV1_01585 [Bacillota bacterium]